MSNDYNVIGNLFLFTNVNVAGSKLSFLKKQPGHTVATDTSINASTSDL